MSRMIFGLALGFGLAVAVGCGSKPAPTQPSAPLQEPEPKKDPEPKVEPPKAEPPKTEPAKVVWELDPAKHVVPEAPVSGTLGGSAFVPAVVLEGAELKFRTFKAGAPNPEREIVITLPPPVEGRKIVVKPEEPNSPALPRIFVQFPPSAPGQAGGALFPGSHASYALTLELGPRKGGKATGRIQLSLQDEAKTVIAGTFTAEYLRPHTEKPGPDDVPYLSGDVKVTGVDPKAEIRVAFAAFLPDGSAFFKEHQLPADPKPLDQVQWISDDEKPRSSALIPGDGKDRPFRYEYVRLKPGRYLLSAALVGGPAVWEWVDVPAGGAVVKDFALDVGKTGGIELTAAPDAKGPVFIAPADEPTRPTMDPKLFEWVSRQVVRTEVTVVAGKALAKNLGPGRYEVRFGDERRIVDVTPGKTAEVNIAPPKK